MGKGSTAQRRRLKVLKSKLLLEPTLLPHATAFAAKANLTSQAKLCKSFPKAKELSLNSNFRIRTQKTANTKTTAI